MNETPIDLEIVEQIIKKTGRGPEAAVPILQALQEHYRYLPPEALRRVCELTEITPAQIAGVSTFYAQFRHAPVGRHLVRVCHGTACHVAGAERITDALRRHLRVGEGRDTDPEKLFTLEKVACLGCCSLAPVMLVGDRAYGHLTPDSACRALESFLREAEKKEEGRAAAGEEALAGRGPGAVEVRVGLGSCGVAAGGREVRAALLRAVGAAGAEARVKIVGCNGMCHREPLVEFVTPQGTRRLYGGFRPALARRLLRHHAPPRRLRDRARALARGAWDKLAEDAAWDSLARYEIDPEAQDTAAFLKKQKRIVLENCGKIDPLSLDEYLAGGGYVALEKCLRQLRPEEIIETISASGLRGRGGAGFSTGRKWALARSQPAEKKYLVGNGDEGDPGAFMDRSLLEGDPHRVLEGMAIAAYAVGADEGYLYVRAEYPLAVAHARRAIEQATARGFLGENVLGTGFNFRLRIREGAGAFVCGEETALLASLEGRRGMPRFRPPFPVERGLWGQPTLINNVETYANVPWIIRHGPESFAQLGTASSKGTKIFALAGKVRRGGLIEVPMGVTIREIVEEIGGGIRGGGKFKAVQIGGPSGGCLPASLADTPIDYEALTRTGAIMGSGGLVVLDDTDCMVDIARFFLRFTQAESCGKCTFCRIGTQRLLELLDRLAEGEGRTGDLEKLEELCLLVGRASLCGLGQTAPNPALTTLKYFREEYEAHLKERRCPAGKCKALIEYVITDECYGCTLCAQNCPSDAIAFRPYEKHRIVPERCLRCGTCRLVCPAGAVEVRSGGLPAGRHGLPAVAQGQNQAEGAAHAPGNH